MIWMTWWEGGVVRLKNWLLLKNVGDLIVTRPMGWVMALWQAGKQVDSSHLSASLRPNSMSLEWNLIAGFGFSHELPALFGQRLSRFGSENFGCQWSDYAVNFLWDFFVFKWKSTASSSVSLSMKNSELQSVAIKFFNWTHLNMKQRTLIGRLNHVKNKMKIKCQISYPKVVQSLKRRIKFAYLVKSLLKVSCL